MPCRHQSVFGGTPATSGFYATEAECLEACKEGACCNGTTCSVKPQCQCNAAAGEVFKGIGTVCSPNPCCQCPDGLEAAYPDQIAVSFSVSGFTWQPVFGQTAPAEGAAENAASLLANVALVLPASELSYRYLDRPCPLGDCCTEAGLLSPDLVRSRVSGSLQCTGRFSGVFELGTISPFFFGQPFTQAEMDGLCSGGGVFEYKVLFRSQFNPLQFSIDLPCSGGRFSPQSVALPVIGVDVYLISALGYTWSVSNVAMTATPIYANPLP